MKRIPILLLPALLAGCAWLAPTYHRPQCQSALKNNP